MAQGSFAHFSTQDLRQLWVLVIALRMAVETKMKYFIKYFALGLLFMILLTYALGWYDLVNNNWLAGNWLKDFYKSITYYLGWVLIYWWVFILMGGLLIGIVTTGAFALVSTLRK